LATENWSPWAIVWRCLLDPVFSRFDTVSACDRLTDRHYDSIYRTICIASRGKMGHVTLTTLFWGVVWRS